MQWHGLVRLRAINHDTDSHVASLCGIARQINTFRQIVGAAGCTSGAFCRLPTSVLYGLVIGGGNGCHPVIADQADIEGFAIGISTKALQPVPQTCDR